jgi:rhodanese-related sulfurtransferase
MKRAAESSQIASRRLITFFPALSCLLALGALPLKAHTDITPTVARDMILAGDAIVLDVRENSEFCGLVQHIEDAANLPWNSAVLQARYAVLPTDVDIIVVCASGNRSNQAAGFLDSQGFTNIFDMLGGMGAWSWETEPCDAEPAVRLDKPVSDPEINWTPTTGVQDYDLLRGLVEDVALGVGTVDLGVTECLVDDTPFTFYTDPGSVTPGSCRFYLARQKDGSWGESSGRFQREPGTEDCELP